MAEKVEKYTLGSHFTVEVARLPWIKNVLFWLSNGGVAI